MAIGALLNKALPIPLAIKALSKVNTKMGKFIIDATSYGYAADQILDFLRSENGESTKERSRLESGAPNLRPDELSNLQRMKQEEAPEKALQKGVSIATGLGGAIGGLGNEQESGQVPEEPKRDVAVSPSAPTQLKRAAEMPQDITGAISPELKRFVEDRLSKGSPLNRIAGLAKSHFFNEIKKIQDESGMEFSEYLESLYGDNREQARVEGLKQPAPTQGKQDLANSIMQAAQMIQQLRGK